MNLLPYFASIPYRGGIGICPLSALAMTEQAAANANSLCPGAQSVAVILFPYLVRDTVPRNLSLYACGADYHQVVADALRPVCQTLTRDFPAYHFVPLADASPIPEVQAAWISGAGILGKNGLIFDRTYGSFVFIGTVLTNAPADPTPSSRRVCPNCGACRRACPLGALHEDGTVDVSRCLSDLTQSKQPLTPEQEQALQRHPLIWGCDLCSEVCPLNRDVPETPNPAFRDSRVTRLSRTDVDGMTRRQFHERHPDRAFTWRGPKPILRNLKLHGE
ncbi:MAG: DUF1730 domain-containing protein [Eubacteriales bacterium]|nr:DUF1730 domain-containing protein [Eubacteriales bacterium]